MNRGASPLDPGSGPGWREGRASARVLSGDFRLLREYGALAMTNKIFSGPFKRYKKEIKNKSFSSFASPIPGLAAATRIAGTPRVPRGLR
jgi:hypothetical protein